MRKILQVDGECKKEWLGVSGFGDAGGDVKQCDVLKLKVQNVNGGRKIDIAACVVPKITEGLKSEHVNVVKLEYEHLKNLHFSDISTKETLATDVQTDYLWYFQGGDVIKDQPGEPVAIKTVLGYVLSGPVHGGKSEKVSTNLVINETKENLQLEKQVMQLWDYDSIGIREQNEVHEYLLDNIEFTGERYRVQLPWKIGHPFLPDNYDLSLGRLKSQLRRLKNEPIVLREYDKIICDQGKEEIVEKIGNEESTAKRIHYLPHQAVIRKDAETTKVRVVFDASAKERKNGVSLNQCLHVGPSLVPMLYDVLLKIREHEVALFGDIKQAFQNIEVATEDRDAMRFLWVDNVLGDDLQLVPYRFNRVIFGAGPSPFLLTGTMRHYFAKYSNVDPDLWKR